MTSPARSPRTLVAALTGSAAAVLVVAQPVAAHSEPVAGGLVDGLTHPLFGLDHLLAMVAVGILAATAPSRRAAWLTPVGFLAGMVLGGLAGLVGSPSGVVESVIALSVILVGILVVTARTVGARLPLVVGVIGAFHGVAHGAEIPSGAMPVAYVAGFVVATAVLHLAGVVVGLGLRRVPSVRVATGSLLSGAGVLLLLGA